MSESHTADLATRARYRQEGADYEQERIIKLLEDKYLHRDIDGKPLDNFHNDNLREAIALIKGEGK